MGNKRIIINYYQGTASDRNIYIYSVHANKKLILLYVYVVRVHIYIYNI